MYADMLGYSRLIALDDIGTLERLRALRRDVIDPARSLRATELIERVSAKRIPAYQARGSSNSA
jgi:hypothetical protein